jgi:hypothetical protein
LHHQFSRKALSVDFCITSSAVNTLLLFPQASKRKREKCSKTVKSFFNYYERFTTGLLVQKSAPRALLLNR